MELIARSHGNDYTRRKHRRTAAQRFRTLRHAGLLELKGVDGYAGRYVRPAPGADPDHVATAVRARCEQRLARFKQPSRIEVVDELPLTVTGKVQKGRLRGLERRRALGLLE